MSWTTALAIGVPVAVAIGIAVWQDLRRRRNEQPRLVVTLTNGVPIGLPGADRAILIVTAVNEGRGPVTLDGIGLLAPGGRSMVVLSPRVRLPVRLAQGEVCKEWMNIPEVAARLRAIGCSGSVKLRGYVTDAAGRRHDSKPFPVNVDGWGPPRQLADESGDEGGISPV